MRDATLSRQFRECVEVCYPDESRMPDARGMETLRRFFMLGACEFNSLSAFIHDDSRSEEECVIRAARLFAELDHFVADMRRIKEEYDRKRKAEELPGARRPDA